MLPKQRGPIVAQVVQTATRDRIYFFPLKFLTPKNVASSKILYCETSLTYGMYQLT